MRRIKTKGCLELNENFAVSHPELLVLQSDYFTDQSPVNVAIFREIIE